MEANTRRPSKACTNHLVGGGYDTQLNIVRTIVDAYKSAGMTQGAQPTPTLDAPPAIDAPPTTEDETIEPQGGVVAPTPSATHCKTLETKMCEALDAQCKIWRTDGMPGLKGINDMQCKMALEKTFFFAKRLQEAQGK